MKKYLMGLSAGLLALLLFLSVPLQTKAAGISLNGASSTTIGSTITLTVSSSGYTCGAGSIEFNFNSADFEIVSGEWTLGSNCLLPDFNASSKTGAFLMKNAVNVSGNIFTLKLKAKRYNAAAKISVTVKFGSGASDPTVSASKTVAINCATHNFGGWSVTSSPTCTTAGQQVRTCSVCGTKETKTDAALGHIITSYTTTLEPTCTTKGTKAAVCSRCNGVVKQSIPALGHNYGKWTEEVAATCSSEGSEICTCSRCGYEAHRTVEVLPHSFASYVSKDPTCLDKGERTYYCTVCTFMKFESIAPLGHDYGPWMNVTPSSCTEAGIDSHSCRRCSIAETRAAELAPHDIGNSAKILREPTIAVLGLVSGTCINCGADCETFIPCHYTDSNTKLGISADEGVFLPGTEIKVVLEKSHVNDKGVEQNSVISTCRKALGDTENSLVVYTWDAKVYGNSVKPMGSCTLEIPYPKNFSKYYSVYEVQKNGTLSLLGCTCSEDGSTLYVTTSSTGTLCLYDLTAPEAPAPDPSVELKMALILAVGIFVVAFIIGLMIGSTKAKKQAPVETETADDIIAKLSKE